MRLKNKMVSLLCGRMLVIFRVVSLAIGQELSGLTLAFVNKQQDMFIIVILKVRIFTRVCAIICAQIGACKPRLEA